MPIANYSVLAGRPTAGKVVSGASAHYQITMQASGGPFTVAVNIQSVDGSEVLYAIEEGFTPPDLAGLSVAAGLRLEAPVRRLAEVPAVVETGGWRGAQVRPGFDQDDAPMALALVSQTPRKHAPGGAAADDREVEALSPGR